MPTDNPEQVHIYHQFPRKYGMGQVYIYSNPKSFMRMGTDIVNLYQ